MRQITFNDIPLISINSSGCPTCESLIATGCGLEKTDFFIEWIVYDTDPHSMLARVANSYLDNLS